MTSKYLSLDPNHVVVPKRMRSLQADKVGELAESMNTSIGQLQAIGVRKHRDSWHLVWGEHRLAAAKKNGQNIDAKDVSGMNEWECVLAEVYENIHATPTGMESAIMLSRAKEAHLHLYPETARGVAGANASNHSQGRVTTDKMSVVTPSFVEATATAIGQSTRNVERIVAAGDKLDTDAVKTISAAAPSVAKSNKERDALASLTKNEQKEVAKAIESGEAKSVTEAVAAMTEEESEEDDSDGLCAEALNAKTTESIKAGKEQWKRLAELDDDEQRPIVDSVKAGRQTLKDALDNGVAPPTIEEKINQNAGAKEAFCKALKKVFDSGIDVLDDPWGQDLNRKQGAIDKFKALLETIRSCKPSKPCPRCSGDGCKDCHKTGMVTTNAYQQLV